MIGDGATDMEASPPAVSPDVIQFSSTEPWPRQFSSVATSFNIPTS
jgi:hypothetical protein